MRLDPVFKLPTPLLIAHRGGAKEVPESTALAFRHALEHGANVLELDVGATADDELVVWHGPALDNVRIAGVTCDVTRRPRGRLELSDFRWRELDGKAWVAAPGEAVAEVPRVDERRLLRFGDLLRLFDEAPLNVELKNSVRPKHLKEVARLLRMHGKGRPIVLARNVTPCLLNALQTEMLGRPLLQNLPLTSLWKARLHLGSLRQRAVQVSHRDSSLEEGFIRRVHREGGAVHVFLTAFTRLVPDLELESDRVVAARLNELLDLGVDGIMTDQPKRIGPMIRKWG